MPHKRRRNLSRYKTDPAYREVIKARTKKYYHANKEMLRQKATEYYKAHPGIRSAVERKRLLKRKYGLTIAQYNQMYETQQGCWYICKAKTKLRVDHNHLTGHVRRLLCQCCNTLIGMAKESILVLSNSIQYLKETHEASEPG